MGTPDYADFILKDLLKEETINVKAVFTQPDKKVGRKQIVTPSIVKVTANEHNIEVFQPVTLRDESTLNILTGLKPQFIIVAAYGQILPKSILDIAPCINLHASLLPKYRGASPIQSSILNSDKKTGVTSMLMAEGLDTGDVLGFAYTDVGEKVCGDLFDELSRIAGKLTVDTLNNFNEIKPLMQSDADSDYVKKITKNDGLVNFDSLKLLKQKFLAYNPWPGTFLENGIKLLDLEFVDDEKSYTPGEILEIEKESIVVGCLTGKVKINTLQPKSKKPMDSGSFIRGKRLEVGDSIL